MDTDQALIARLVAGEPHALAELYDRFGVKLYTLALRILKNSQDAEDLIHDVFLEVSKRAVDYDHRRGSVQAWLVIRTRSRSLDRLRVLKRFNEFATVQTPPKDTSPNDDFTPDVLADHAKAKLALAVLPESQRVVLELSYFGGLSHEEIAQRCRIPVGTAKSRLAAAVIKLRRHFDLGQKEVES